MAKSNTSKVVIFKYNGSTCTMIFFSSSNQELQTRIVLNGGTEGIPPPVITPPSDIISILEPEILDELDTLLTNSSAKIGVTIDVSDPRRYGTACNIV